jgi:hypothetical protein
MSVQGQRTPEYEDIFSALRTLETGSPDHLPGVQETDCDREALGCWWTCPREVRQQCALQPRVFGIEAAA